MAEISEELLDSIHSARACLVDISELAGKLSHLSVEELEPLFLEFVEEGEDKALSRLLQACAFNKLKLDPSILCRCIGVCEDITDTAPCIALQDSNAVQPLLAVDAAEEVSTERKIYAVRLAAELTVKYKLDPQPVRKVLWKQEQSPLSPVFKLLISQSLQLLEQDSRTEQPHSINWISLKLSDLLPEHRPRTGIGGTYTVRRPIPKLGRNDPCHCGSGKKYKKCCYAKDQELLRDASQYAGTTRSELKRSPSLVDDPDVIYNMRAYELKRLKPCELSDNQLFAGYLCSLDYGLRELAFEMLQEQEKRPGETEFDPGHFQDLLEEVLDAGDLDLAQKIRDHCGEQTLHRPHAIQFRFDLLENPERFEPLEHNCRKSVCGILDDETEGDDPLIRLAFDLAQHYPSLAIVFARAAIASYPDRYLENEVLLSTIRKTRVDLDLEPWNDPAESLFDWIEDRDQLRVKKDTEDKKIRQLTNKLQSARIALDEKKQVLREMEQTVKETGRKLVKAQAPIKQEAAGEQETETAGYQEREETLRRLRSQVENLKAEIGEQQEQRGKLRKLLADERKKHSELSAKHASEGPAEPIEEPLYIEPSGRPTLPQYSEAFRKRCDSLPPSLAAKAILVAGRFASHENEIWRQTQAIKRLPEHYRIRISLDYRMIVRWQPGKSLHILDVIPRQDLESWIKRHG